MSNKPVLGGINSILRKQREEATSASGSGSAVADAAKVATVVTPTTDRPHSTAEKRDRRDDPPSDTDLLDTNSAAAVPDAPDTVGETTFLPNNIARGVDSRPVAPKSDQQRNKLKAPRPVPPSVFAKAKTSSDASPEAGATVVADVLPSPRNTEAFIAESPVVTSSELFERGRSNDDNVTTSTAFSLGDQVLKLNLAGNELRLYDFIYRHTIAVGRPTCRVNIKDLQNHLGLTQMSVFRILNRLEIKRGIRRQKIEENRRLIGIELSLVV